MSKSILEALADSKFLATDAQVESLASLAAEGQQASGTYLSVLTAHVIKALAKVKRATKAAQLATVDKVQEHLYPHILKGVAPANVEQDERNRLAIFARTAASDLRHFVRMGGDARKLDPAEVRKHVLRSEGKEVPTGTRAERAFSRAQLAIASSAKRIARTDPEEALARLRAAMGKLEEVIDEIEHAEKPAKGKRKAKQAAKVAPMSHRPPVGGARVVGANLVKTPGPGGAPTTFG